MNIYFKRGKEKGVGGIQNRQISLVNELLEKHYAREGKK
jgi:hypothetical protein